jgi:hypothetical protein
LALPFGPGALAFLLSFLLLAHLLAALLIAHVFDLALEIPLGIEVHVEAVATVMFFEIVPRAEARVATTARAVVETHGSA